MAFVAVIPAVGGAIATGVGAIGAGLASGLGAIGGLASSIPVIGGVLGPAVSGLGGMVGSIGSGLAGGIGGLAAGNIGGAVSSLGSGLLGAGSNLLGGLGGMYTGVDKMVGGALPNIGSAGVTPSWVNPAAPAGSVPMTDASGLPQMSLPGSGGPPLGEVAGMPTGSGGGGAFDGLKGIANTIGKIGKTGQALGLGNSGKQRSSGGVSQTGVQTRPITAPQTTIIRGGQPIGGQRSQLNLAGQPAGYAQNQQAAVQYNNQLTGGVNPSVKNYNPYQRGAMTPEEEEIQRRQAAAMGAGNSLQNVYGSRVTSMR